jgi:DNA repair ATPase RecN
MVDDNELRPAQGSPIPAVEGLFGWAARLGREVAQLPDTLERLRTGANDFQLVARRLAESSEALEQLTNLYGKTMGDAVRRSGEAAERIRAQLDQLPQSGSNTDLAAAAAAEMQRTLRSLAALNPFWTSGETRERP